MEDPFQYIGRATRDDAGRLHLEVFTDMDDKITLSEGDEFVTFVTVIDLDGVAR